jgi:ABC-type nitrate/sulfonate/bicarbonate transport system substrate-binding protein
MEMHYLSKAIRVAVAMVVTATALSLAGPARAKDLIPIRIAATADAVSLAQWIAIKEGIFRKYGLDPKETVYNVNYQGLLAIGAQQNDVSIQADPPTIGSLSKGIDAVVVAVVARFTDGYKLVAPNSVRSMDELAGKKVAWPTGTGAEYALAALSTAKGFDMARFEHVDLPPAEGVPLLIKGDLSGIMYWEPWPRMAVAKGGGRFHVLATSKGSYESNMFLTVRRSFAQQNPEAVKNLLRALREAQQVLQQHPEKGVEIFRARMRVDAEAARAAIGDYTLMLTLDRQTANTAQGVAEWLKKINRVEKLPDWSTAFDASYLKAVDSSAVKDFPW